MSKYNNSGQALIALVIFMVVATIIISGAVTVIVVNSTTTGKFYQGVVSYDIAEAGIENALIRLLRNPNYTGETLTIGSDTATIQVTGGDGTPYTIMSTSQAGNFKRAIQAVAEYNNNILTINSWKEQ